MSTLDPLLHRQLRLLGLDDTGFAPTPETWTTVLRWVSDHYRSMAEERRLLRESFEGEIRDLYRELATERERANEVFATTTAALALLEDALRAGRDRETFPAALRAVLEDMGTSDERSATLGARIGRLGHKLHTLLADAATDAEAAADLARAGKLQRAWMPPEEVLVRGRVELLGACYPAGHCGGDWWTVRDLDDRRALLLVGDATGHGADAAMITAVARGAVDVAVRAFQPQSAGEVLEAINGAIFSAGEQRVQMTCAAAIFDVVDGTITAASAGHVLPCVLRADGSLDQILATGPALGAISGASYADSPSELGEGDAVLWYTDGLIECEDPSGRQFGPRRLRKVLSRLASRAPEHIREAIACELAVFAGNTPPVDDIALVVARFGHSRRRPTASWTRP